MAEPSELGETAEDDLVFMTWLRYATLEALYDYLATAPIPTRTRHKWKRVATAREICRREK